MRTPQPTSVSTPRTSQRDARAWTASRAPARGDVRVPLGEALAAPVPGPFATGPLDHKLYTVSNSTSEVRRPYLRVEDRRRKLIDAAAQIAGREGLDRVTMAGVAKEAGVSRQLVYEHFADLPSLAAALVYDRFGRLDAATDAILGSRGSDGSAAIRAAARLVLSLSSQDRHIVRALLAHASLPDHELSELAAKLRARMIKRWSTTLRTTTSSHAGPIVWALLHALFALGDLVDAREITVAQALERFDGLLAGGVQEAEGRAR